MADPLRNTVSTVLRSTGVSALVAVAAVAALVVTFKLAVGTRTGQVLDTRVMTAVSRNLDDLDWATTILGTISPWTVLAATAVLAGSAWVSRGGSAAFAVVATALGTMGLAVVLKEALVRPQLLDGYVNSFPSGHAAAMAGLAAAAVLAVKPPVARFLVGALGLGAVAVTGLATLALKWHRPSDVAASVLIAVAVLMMIKLLLPGSWDGRPIHP